MQLVSVALSQAIEPFSIDSQLAEWRKFHYAKVAKGGYPPSGLRKVNREFLKYFLNWVL